MKVFPLNGRVVAQKVVLGRSVRLQVKGCETMDLVQ